MAKAKDKRLPDDFEKMLGQADLATLQAIFDRCDVDARGGYAEQTALAFDECPDDLARWLVARGADLRAADLRRNTPLHTRARSRRGRIAVLIELGADVRAAGAPIGTPLHAAADAKRAENAELLLRAGAEVDARNAEGLTPLELALRGCRNIELAAMAALARVLLGAGARRSPSTKKLVAEIGKGFEFHRSSFSPEHVDAASTALDEIYAIFDCVPVARRVVHDGTSPIVVKATGWQKQHAELWDLLIPSSGPAATVQGEVIRIAGRIARELDDNGGLNWDEVFEAMASAFLQHVQSGSSLAAAELADVREIVDSLIRDESGDTDRMAELAVTWVLQNPVPVLLTRPGTTR